jgi:AraC-like DNA-binding protein
MSDLISPALVLRLTLPANRSIAIPPGCAVFVRRGTAAWQTRSSDVLLDVNHALLFPEAADLAVLTANDVPAALSFIRSSHIDFGGAPCVRIVDSQTFLDHYRLAFHADDLGAVQHAACIVAAIRFNAPKKPVTLSARSPSYGRIMQHYVNDTLAQRLHLRDVAQTCAVSPFTASRVFHREAGIPLRLYVRRLRARTALAHICARRDLAAVAQELGFFDHAHFTKAFRAEFGIAPSEWREYVASLGVAA